MSRSFAENCEYVYSDEEEWRCQKDGELCTPEREQECESTYAEFQYEGTREGYD